MSLSSNENKQNELEYMMKINHEVMLCTLETQSSKRLSLYVHPLVILNDRSQKQCGHSTDCLA